MKARSSSHANYCWREWKTSDTWVCKFKYINKNSTQVVEGWKERKENFRAKYFCNSRVKLNMHHAVVSRCLSKFQVVLTGDLFMMNVSAENFWFVAACLTKTETISASVDAFLFPIRRIIFACLMTWNNSIGSSLKIISSSVHMAHKMHMEK